MFENAKSSDESDMSNDEFDNGDDNDEDYIPDDSSSDPSSSEDEEDMARSNISPLKDAKYVVFQENLTPWLPTKINCNVPPV